MKKLIIGLFIIGLTSQIFAQIQTQQLPEVKIVHNYKYLSSTTSEDLAIPVKELQLKASDFNVKDLDIYSDDNEYYSVYFIIPEGKILASYDETGELLRTIERYKDIDLPSPVKNAIALRFPNWTVSNNIYLVNYHESGKTKKLYKITLENNDKRIKVKVNDIGAFQ